MFWWLLRALRRESHHKSRGRNPSRPFAAPEVSALPEALDIERRIGLPVTAPVVSVRRRRRVPAEALHG